MPDLYRLRGLRLLPFGRLRRLQPAQSLPKVCRRLGQRPDAHSEEADRIQAGHGLEEGFSFGGVPARWN